MSLNEMQRFALSNAIHNQPINRAVRHGRGRGGYNIFLIHMRNLVCELPLIPCLHILKCYQLPPPFLKPCGGPDKLARLHKDWWHQHFAKKPSSPINFSKFFLLLLWKTGKSLMDMITTNRHLAFLLIKIGTFQKSLVPFKNTATPMLSQGFKSINSLYSTTMMSLISFRIQPWQKRYRPL